MKKIRVKRVRRTPRERSKLKIRKRLTGSDNKPRVCVFTSSRFTYAQVISDVSGKTLLSLSTRDKDVQSQVSEVDLAKLASKANSSKSCAAAMALGIALGKKIISSGINEAVFDRNGYQYHGRVKAVAEGIREAGFKI